MDIHCEEGKVFVNRLRPGDMFEVCDTTYKLVYCNESRAYVQDMTKKHHEIVKDDGTKTEWDSRAGFANISPMTQVVKLEGKAMTEFVSKTKQRGGKPAQAPIKACKKGTKRGNILEQLLAEDMAGEISIEKVCRHLGIKRALLLTHCFEINRDHGMGYAVDKDSLTIEFLPGIDPFAEPAVEAFDDLV